MYFESVNQHMLFEFLINIFWLYLVLETVMSNIKTYQTSQFVRRPRIQLQTKSAVHAYTLLDSSVCVPTKWRLL
jgi:hypothetical protein